jgi:peptidoglycan hydrolase-like protein with peptidoglycan-binding domain
VRGPAALVLAAALVVAGCGGDDPDKQLNRAQAKVEQKKEALTEAKQAFADASGAFCQSSVGYVVALDRYGDLLHSTAPTVGDVKEAGADLADPGDEAITAAEDAVAAHREVAAAEQELADAQAALKQLKNGSKTPDAGATGSTPSASPLVPAATVNKVKAAEADFASAASGVTDQTPLTQAAAEFNAAAVALEVAWIQLVVDAGCLSSEQQEQAEDAVRAFTTSLQQSLQEAGYYSGKVDGVYGDATVAAVEALQQAHGLPVTGAVDKATQAALEADLQQVGGAAAQDATASTAAVQQTLKLAGYWDGPVDGAWTPELTEALEEFQKVLGVKQTGAVDAATIAALEDAIAVAQEARSAGGSASPSPTPGSPTTDSPSGGPPPTLPASSSPSASS